MIQLTCNEIYSIMGKLLHKVIESIYVKNSLYPKKSTKVQ